jgi:hypothetical protein
MVWAQAWSLNLSGSPGQGETQEADNYRKVQEDMAFFETVVQFVRFINMVYMAFNQGLLFFTVFNKTSEHPEQSVNPEYSEGTYQQAYHGLEGPVHQGVVFTVVVTTV